MEKITFKNSEGLRLAGILHLPRDKIASAIIVSHGFTASKDRQRFVALSEILADEGFAVLRFDFGGCGESEDREITPKHQVNDLKSAIKYMRDMGYRDIGLLGVSFGGLISVMCYDVHVKAMVLWSPVTKATEQSIVLKEELKQELNDKGYLMYKRGGREFKIPQEYFDERKAVNQKEMLSKVKCPVLIVYGNMDDIVPIENSKDAMQFLNKESRLEIIDGGDHVLDAKMDEVIPFSVDWFKKYLLRGY